MGAGGSGGGSGSALLATLSALAAAAKPVGTTGGRSPVWPAGSACWAAPLAGAGPLRIIFRHVLPNALAPVLVPVTFGIASAILAETSLSFLGFGPPPPTASWGSILNDARANLAMWWLVVFPGTAIFLTVLAYNLVGEGLQEATDPRLREARK